VRGAGTIAATSGEGVRSAFATRRMSRATRRCGRRRVRRSVPTGATSSVRMLVRQRSQQNPSHQREYGRRWQPMPSAKRPRSQPRRIPGCGARMRNRVRGRPRPASSNARKPNPSRAAFFVPFDAGRKSRIADRRASSGDMAGPHSLGRSRTRCDTASRRPSPARRHLRRKGARDSRRATRRRNSPGGWLRHSESRCAIGGPRNASQVSTFFRHLSSAGPRYCL